MTEREQFNRVASVVESTLEVPKDALLGRSRPESVAVARHALVWLCHHALGMSTRTIAKLMGRDRTCPENSILRWKAIIATQPRMAALCTLMERQIRMCDGRDSDFEHWWLTSGEPAAKAIAASQWAACQTLTSGTQQACETHEAPQ